MLLGSSLQLPPPVLVMSSPSGVLLLETKMGLLSGEWVEVLSVHWYTKHLSPTPAFVGHTMCTQLCLVLGLEQVVLPSHQH